VLNATVFVYPFCLFCFIFFFWKVVCSSTDGSDELFQKEIAASNNKRGPFVFGFIDLFSGSGESWNWGFVMDEKSAMNSSVQPNPVEGAKLGYEVQKKEPDKSTKQLKMQDTKQGLLPSSNAILDTLEEETEDSNKSISSTDSSRSLEEDLVRNDTDDEKDVSNVGPN
jgi:translation initiation factor 2-alpha kinase 4